MDAATTPLWLAVDVASSLGIQGAGHLARTRHLMECLGAGEPQRRRDFFSVLLLFSR
jgi:hypothetical protein